MWNISIVDSDGVWAHSYDVCVSWSWRNRFTRQSN